MAALPRDDSVEKPGLALLLQTRSRFSHCNFFFCHYITRRNTCGAFPTTATKRGEAGPLDKRKGGGRMAKAPAKKRATAAKTPAKKAAKTAAPKAAKAAAKPAAARAKKPARARKGKVTKGDRYACDVCGLVVSVDEICGCVDACDIICCGEQMTAA